VNGDSNEQCKARVCSEMNATLMPRQGAVKTELVGQRRNRDAQKRGSNQFRPIKEQSQ
jgi:hypothetical protein